MMSDDDDTDDAWGFGVLIGYGAVAGFSVGDENTTT